MFCSTRVNLHQPMPIYRQQHKKVYTMRLMTNPRARFSEISPEVSYRIIFFSLIRGVNSFLHSCIISCSSRDVNFFCLTTA